MNTCPTCEGRGKLGKTLHWNDCPPGCDRVHSSTCIVCWGIGQVKQDRVFLSTVNRKKKHIAVSVFPVKDKP